MIFHVRCKCVQSLSLKTENITVETVEELMYLGLTLNLYLNKTHTENVIKKCTKIFGVLNRQKHALPIEIKRLDITTYKLLHYEIGITG